MIFAYPSWYTEAEAAQAHADARHDAEPDWAGQGFSTPYTEPEAEAG